MGAVMGVIAAVTQVAQVVQTIETAIQGIATPQEQNGLEAHPKGFEPDPGFEDPGFDPNMPPSGMRREPQIPSPSNGINQAPVESGGMGLSAPSLKV